MESRSEFINAYKYLNRGGKEDRPRLISVVPCDRMRGNEHTLKHGSFPLNSRKHFFTVRVTKHWYGLLRSVMEFPSLEIFKSHLDMGQGSLFEKAAPLTSRGPFKPQ